MKFFQDGSAWLLTENGIRRKDARNARANDATPRGLEKSPAESVAVHFPERAKAFAVAFPAAKQGAALFAETSNGGTDWTESNVPIDYKGDAPGFAGHVFALDQDVWLLAKVQTSSAGSQAVLYRRHAGSWMRESAPVDGALVFASTSIGWLAGGAAGGELYKTNNGGETWSKAATPRKSSDSPWRTTVAAPIFLDAKNGVLPIQVHDSETGTASDLFFYSTNDSGDTWKPAGDPIHADPDGGAVFLGNVTRLDVVDAKTWFVLADGLWMTSNAGSSWQHVNEDIRGSTFDFVTAQEGWLAREVTRCAAPKKDCSTSRSFLHTADGGRTWEEDTP